MNKSTMTIVAALAAGAAVATTRTPYANDFTTRTSGATPSDRWMESQYIPGALVRSVGSISAHGREPYNSDTAYQDGWTMKEGTERSGVFFRVADDNGNQCVLVTNKSSSVVTDATVAIQPFYNEFTDGVLKISADIRTPASSAFVSNTTAYASIIPVYKSTLDVAASSFPTPTRLGMANASHNNSSTGDFYVRANVMSKNIAETGSGTYGYSEARNNLTAGNWYRYEAVIDIAAGTFTATFGNLGATHPSPDSVPTTVTDFRRYVNDWTTTFKLNTAPSASTGGFAGLAIYVLGFKKAAASAAPMFDNIAVSWKAPGASDFAPVYENNFTTRRYRQVEPSGTISCAYALAPTTNTIQSSFYERANINNDYGVSEDNARRLVPDGAPYAGQDGWRRIAGTAPFTMVDPNKDSSGYGWNNASVLRATGSGKTGMIAAPLGTTVSSGKVRLYCDILMGALTNSTSIQRDIGAAAFLAGDGAYTNSYYSSTNIRAADITTALRGKGVCGAGTCWGYMNAGEYLSSNTRIHRFNGSSYGTLKDTAGENVFISCGRWGRYVVTLDLDAGKYDVAIYNLGYVGQPMDYKHSSSTLLIATNNLSLAASAIRNVDSVVLFSEGQDNANSDTRVTTFNSKKLGRFPLFDNVRVCLVNGDGTDGTELYSCNFEYGYRMSVQNAASLVGHSNREGADRWIRRGNAYGLFNVIDAGGGDRVLALDGFGWIEQVTRTSYAVQPFGASSRNCASVDFAADIRPPECFARDSSCFARVEVGGDDYAQGVYRPASGNNWRSEPRIGFGFAISGGKNAVGHYTNVLISVQSRTSSATTTTNSAVAIDKSHWYRFRVKAQPTNAGGKFTVNVYDQGATKPAANAADGTLVETFSDLALPAFGGEGMTTFGLAAAGFAGMGGGIDDPNVALVDNLSVNFNPAAFVIVFK